MKRLSKIRALAALLFACAGANVFSQTSVADLIKAQQSGTAAQGTAQISGIANAVGSAFGTAGKGESAADATLPETGARAVLAMATEDYPATPGDVYKLIYLKVTQPDTLNLIVEGDGSINAGFLGRFSTKGATFRQVKAQIEKKVADSYPGSNPSLVIVSTGLFPVMVRGEVLRSGLSTAWGLSRLSEVIAGFCTEYSSLRDVAVISGDGKTATYDLFSARRSGDLRQDPYLKPGDIVDVKKAERVVTLEGEVRRPGKYQLLAGEGLAELLSLYGNGALESARTDLLIVMRMATAQKPDAESLVVDLAAGTLPALTDGDSVKVPSRSDYLPVVYLEGAITTERMAGEKQAAAAVAEQDSYSSVRIPFASGILLSQAVKPFSEKFSPNADLLSAYVVRDGARLAADLEKLLYSHDASQDVALKAGDRIVVPFGLNFAYVKGEVRKSGWIKTTTSLRLSEALRPMLSARSSIRDVRVKGSDGAAAFYDLFKAEREGDLSQDPFVRPGDTIELRPAARIVNLEGEVRRPGEYQLLAGESVAELVSLYGGGVLDTARTDRALLTRPATMQNPEAASLVFDAAANVAPALADGDAVRIPSRDEYLPVVSIEGLRLAGNAGASEATAAALVPAEPDAKAAKAQDTPATTATALYGTIRVPFRSGMLLSQVLKPVVGSLPQDADLERAFVSRAGERIAVNLEKLLYSYDASLDVALKADDRVLISRATGRAYLTGEVAKSAWVDASGALRLSEALKGNLTAKSQIRRVAVKGRDGAEAVYDLFLADRKGDLSQDPLLRPGDVVSVAKAERIVTLEGEVRRPGIYAPLAGESIAELIAVYGDGALESARLDLTVLIRKASAAKPESESMVFDLGGKALPDLFDGDKVRVSSREDYLPVVYLEGAIALEKVKTAAKDAAAAPTADMKAAPEDYGVMRLAYRQGLLLSQAVKGLTDNLSPKADLRKAYVVKAASGSIVQVDLEKLLYAYDANDDIELKVSDRVVIPFGQNYAQIKGEVKKAVLVEVNSTTRLSEALKDNVTSLSSMRNVGITSRGGERKEFDLFKAEREGDLSQDPYLRPGDIVEVKPAERRVKVTGEVRRPGTYQLLPKEGVSELIAAYGDGALESAKTDLVLVTRKTTKERPESESLVVDLNAGTLPMLYDGDEIKVPSREEYLPVVYVEGAVSGAELGVKKEAQAGNAATVVAEQYRVVRLVYRQGQLLSQTLKNLKDQIDPRADLKRAFIVRKGQSSQIMVDLEKLLYRYDSADDIALAASDTIVIPYGSMYAFVSGEVGKSAWVGITGLTRLSEAIASFLTKHSSTRDVSVTSEDGSFVAYDLFRAEREGDLAQDPYLRPGDFIVVRKAERIVTLAGEVTRPGAYQLLSGEGIVELLGYYGDKPLASARTDLAQLTRRATGDKPEAESLFVDLESESLPELANGDTLRVPAREEYLPIVYLEGAIASDKAKTAAKSAADAKQADASVDEYGTVRVLYRQGLSLSQAIKAYTENLSPKADLRKAYIVKASSGAIVPVDLERLLYAYDVKDDLQLKANDRVVIPYASQGAYVTGEVLKSAWVEVTGRTRLSEALKDTLTPYSQVRSVLVKSADGTEKSYDLFLADRKGDLSQDPLLRPGDVVNVARADRLVNVLGEVRRPGKYPLRADEGLKDLVNYYGDGALESAKTDLVVVTRKATIARPESESLVVDLSASVLPELFDGDEIKIPSRDEYLPVVYVEGAIRAEMPESSAALNSQSALSSLPASFQESQSTAVRSAFSEEQKALLGTAIGNDTLAKGENLTATVQQASSFAAAVETYGIKRIPLRKGQRVSFVARQLQKSFSENASLKNAYIARGAERIPINLEKLLYAYDAKDDRELLPDDRLVVPFGGNEALVRGEVAKAMRVQVTSATRLVEVLKGNLTAMSSIRDVEVVSADGSSRSYDLFLVERKGDKSQNPPLRPGDIVEVKRLNRVVAIVGEVNRPGTYQILPGETMRQLVEDYAGGFTEKANASRMAIVRYVSETNPIGEKIILDYAANQDYSLNKYDAINVPPYQDLLPVVWFEGAVGVVGELKTAPQAAQRVPYTYFPGDMVSEAVLANRKLFSEVSDLTNAYIVRSDGPRKAINLSRFLYDRSFSEDLRLEPNDVIVVPFRQFFVTVSGAVRTPGRYPYVPDRTWGYYVNLAGGFDTDRNVNDKVAIYDMNAKKVAHADRFVQPEDMIVAQTNSFVYNMLKVASILSTVISVVALVISILP